MALKTCLEIDGRLLCFPLAVAQIDLWGPPPLGDPLEKLRRWAETASSDLEPDPEPWRTDLSILATIDLLVPHIRDDSLRQQLESAIAEAIKDAARALPSGMRLEK